MDRFQATHHAGPECQDASFSSARERIRLAGLLGFARGLLQATGTTLHQMRSTGLGCFDETTMAGLPGLVTDLEDGTWLRLSRMRAEPAPWPSASLMPWLDGYDRSATTEPTVRAVLLLEVPIETASDLCEGDLLAPDDIHELEPGAADVPVVLRLDRLDELRAELRGWIEGTWREWLENQRPVLASIAVYERLFQLYNRMHGGADTPPELVWGTGVATWRTDTIDIEMPLVEQLADLELEDDGTLAVTPRTLSPSLNLAPFHEADPAAGSRARAKLEATLDALLNEGDGTLSPFMPTHVEPLLLQAASLLAVDGRCVTRSALEAGETAGGPGPTLEIVSSWALYARPRTVGARADDLQRLGAGVNGSSGGSAAEADDASVPPGLLGFVRDLSDITPTDVQPVPTSTSGEGAPSGGWGSDDDSVPASDRATDEVGRSGEIGYYFPLAYNEEQARIVDALEHSPVVTVTGPPGTGKTHTIANIVSHYMATGRRVLVTARTAEAIAAVREKLPEELAALVIASVGSDREGSRQLEDAIERLSDEVVSLDETAVRETAERLESRIRALDSERRELERTLARIAAENLAPLTWDGEERSAMDVALRLEADGAAHAWFEDEPEGPPPSTLDSVVEALRDLLPRVAGDLAHLHASPPDIGSVPSTGELLTLHGALQREAGHPVEDPSGQPAMARDTHDAEHRAVEMLSVLENAASRFDGLEPWVRAAIGQEVRARTAGRTGSDTLEPLRAPVERLASLSLGELQIDDQDLDSDELMRAVTRACDGVRPLSMFESFKNKPLARALDGLRIDGTAPGNVADWVRVRDSLRAETLLPELDSAWSAVSRRLPLPALPAAAVAASKTAQKCIGWHDRIVRAGGKVADWIEPLEALFPFGLDVREALGETDFDTIVRALRANVDVASDTSEQLDRLRAFADAGALPLHGAFGALHEAIANPGTEARKIVRLRGALTEEIARLDRVRPELERAASLLANLRDAGAPAWAAALEASPAEARTLLPESWRETWSRALVRARLDRIRALGNGDEQLARKRALAAERESLLRQLIREKTLLGLRPRMSESVRSALISFMTAVRRYGRGTGAQAGRWRRDMRESAVSASRAAPVWVMPEYKIAEQLPSELGSFDLVVLDEASQCDVTSIASLARGARCLIVGDEKQVSPSSVGIPVARIDVLRAEFLADLPMRNRIDQDTSIFDLACQMYPSSHLMLREHFRCVEPIIRFSTRFYQDRLIPLRVPRPSERFDPPLVDMHVASASRDGYLNRAEADVIVDEIAALVRNPEHAKRDIAVISLLGSKQAEAIEKRLIADSRVGTEAMKRHRIICGDARTLQGQERSIVFLSMVAVPNERGSVRAQSDRDIQQRMNVAMSRACDRLYLVRSVTLDHLKPGDIKADVLLHFQDPMPDGGEGARTDLLDLCESGFERDVCAELVNAGYRVRPQVKAGPFRIDLVVEGENDRRLAIELDGDRWHGPDVWERDMRRQASLERAGWTFWRVFGSQWVANREHHWEDLVGTLGRLGIEPIGAAATGERFSELREFVATGEGLRRTGAGDADETDVDETPPVEESDPRSDEDTVGGASEADAAELDGIDIEPSPAAEPSSEGVAAGGVVDDAPRGREENASEEEPPRSGDVDTTSDAAPGGTAPEAEGSPDSAVAPDFYSEAYRPRLGSLLCGIVDEHGPTDFGALCYRGAADHGLRRVGRVVRETISNALGDRRVRTLSRSGDHETVWPEGSSPGPCLRWIDPPPEARPEWDALCWPARVGLVAQTIADEQEDLHRAVLERLRNRKLVKRLRQEIDRAVEDVRQLEPHERIDRSLTGPHQLVDPYVPPPEELQVAQELPDGGREDVEHEMSPEAERRTAGVEEVSDWVRTLLESEVYARRSRAAGPRGPTTEQMRDLLSALDERDGRLPEAMLAHALDVPTYRVPGMLAAARAVLNADGAVVLSSDGATSVEDRTVRLDRALLAGQFEIDLEVR